ncbi:hypothetical protein [Thermococcus sp.]|uniref:hypothetical protein n=1 Tax=Thermococcus sp. TaxID=35749 RepID=UPI0025D22214|nr:hypothetical protein [Thermococcus sp.]
MRRGQLLSLDAMLSLVIVIVILGAVTNASDIVKGEITSMVGWYERANIADNMLDILTKSPGEPKNWTAAPSTIQVLGLRSNDYSYALSLNKIEALPKIQNVTPVIESLTKAAENKDFKLEVYITRTQFNISGSFPKEIYIDLSSEEDRNIEIGEGATGNNPFAAENVTLDGAPLQKSNKPYTLSPGDVLTFYTLSNITVHDARNNQDYPISADSYVEIYVISAGSNFQVTWNDQGLHITGQGQVRIIVKGYEDNRIHVEANVVYPENSSTPYYALTVINGSETTDANIIQASQERSPWIEHIERRMPLEALRYSENMTISQLESPVEWISGQLKLNIPSYAYLTVSVPSWASGNMTLVIQDGDLLKAAFIEKATANSSLQAVIATSGNTQPPHFYSGNTTVIKIPWDVIFSQFNPDQGSKTISLWVQGNTFNGQVSLEDNGHIITMMQPRFERILLELWVWDDP